MNIKISDPIEKIVYRNNKVEIAQTVDLIEDDQIVVSRNNTLQAHQNGV